MKVCPRCKTQYNDLWRKCMKCHADLILTRKKLLFFNKKTRLPPNCSEYFLEQLVEQANSLIIFSTPEGEALMCNELVEFFTGYTREEIFKSNWLDLLHGGQQVRKEMFKAVMKGCLVSIRSKTYEGAIIRKDGSQCMFSWRVAAIKNEKGSNVGLLCIAHDVTDKKTTEDDIDVHGQKFKDILSSIREYALMTTNLEGKITYYGLGARDIFGWPEDQAYLEDISMIYPKQNRSEIIKSISDQIQKNNKFEQEIKLLRKGDAEFPAILTITPLLNKDGQTIGYTYVAKNITEEKEMEQQMIQSEKMAAVGQLASGVAHEINNPLLVIMGRLDMMEDEKIPEELAKTLDTIKAQSQRMRSVVDRLLTYSRAKKPEVKPLDLNQLLESIAPLLSYHPEFKKITWKEQLEKPLPPVKGDFNQLQEVFVNLGVNACQAMPNGGELSITTRHNKDTNCVEVLVKDSGEGMTDEQLNKLFNPFFSTKDTGTGLGLAICRKIIELHNGRIRVASTHGKGTTFTVELPAAE